MQYIGRKSVSAKLRILLNFAWYLSWVTVGFMLVILLLGVFVPDFATAIQEHVEYKAGGLEIAMDNLNLTPKDIGYFILLGILALAPGLAMYMVVIYQLRKIFATLTDGTPFLTTNATRIKMMGVTLLIWSVVQPLTESLVALSLLDRVHGPEVNANIGLDFGIVFMGLVLLILAEIFRLGAELQEDHDLTV